MLSGWPDVVCRYNHNDDFLLGTTRANTLRLLVDDTGLFYDCLPPSFRKDILELCERGDVTQSSFAFRVPEGGDVWERSGGPGGLPMRTVNNTELVDVAPVVNPAYPDATASARSIIDDDLVSSLARYVQTDMAEVRSYLAEHDGNVPRLFKRSDRPSAPKHEEPQMADDETRDKLTSKERDDLSDSDFAYIDPDGGKHFPIHDAAHVRNALARIAQGAKFGEQALPKVKAAAKRFGITVDEQKNIIDMVEEFRGTLPPWLQKAKDAKGKGDDSDDDSEDDKDDDTSDSKDDSKPDAKAPAKGKAPAKKAPAKREDDEESEERAEDETEETDEDAEARAAEEAKLAEEEAAKAAVAQRYAELLTKRYDPYYFDGDGEE